MIEVLLIGLGAVMVVEGLVYLLAPSLVEEMLAALRDIPLSARRIIGGIIFVLGLIILRLAL